MAETKVQVRKHHPYITEQAALMSRMKRIEGQAKGIQRMIEEDRYCIDIVQQLTALSSAAEEVAFGEMSTGAHNDLGRATELAREMVVEFGMSEELGPLAFPRDPGSPMYPEFGFAKPWSEKTNEDVDRGIKQIVTEQYKRARDMLAERKGALEAVASALMEKEVLDEDELKEILARFGIEVPRRRAQRAAGETPQVSHTDTGDTEKQA